MAYQHTQSLPSTIQVPQQTLYIIVHPEVVAHHDFFLDERAQGLDKLMKEMKLQGGLIIKKFVTKLHPNMPENSPSLIVEVAGAYKELCVARQVYTLRKHGYNAKFSEHCVEYGGAYVYSPPDMEIFLPEHC